MVGDEEFPSRPFRLYWRANAVSAFGTYITLLALQTLVLRCRVARPRPLVVPHGARAGVSPSVVTRGGEWQKVR
jgi:hypothetical protein